MLLEQGLADDDTIGIIVGPFVDVEEEQDEGKLDELDDDDDEDEELEDDDMVVGFVGIKRALVVDEVEFGLY